MSPARWIGLSGLALLVAVGALAQPVMLRYTLPAFSARASVPCLPGAETADLDTLYVWGAPQNGPARILLRRAVAGMQGLQDSVPLELSGVHSLWVTTRTHTGVESCESNLMAVGLAADVPHPAAPHPYRGRAGWFDVAGRRVHGRLAAGVYVHHGQLVVLRTPSALTEEETAQ